MNFGGLIGVDGMSFSERCVHKVFYARLRILPIVEGFLRLLEEFRCLL